MQDRGVETLFSLSGEVPSARDALTPAAVELLQQGALVQGSIREACFVRKLSGGGAVLHVEAAVEPGTRLELELAGGQHLRGIVAWRNGREVGLAFDTPLDVFAVIARDLVSQPGERRRMPRIEVRAPLRLEAGSCTELVCSRDVSQAGAKIEVRSELAPGTPVRLTFDGLLPVSGAIRWWRDGVAGVEFEPEVNWQELMPWLKERRDAALSRSPGGPPPPPHPLTSGAGESETCPAGSVSLNLPARVREGTRRWAIEVTAVTTNQVEFESFAALRLGTLLWIVLPGLEGWPARVIEIDGYRFICAFTQPLHPAVLERVLAASREG